MRVLLVPNNAASMVWFRLPFLRALREAGHRVFVAAPEGSGVERLLAEGVSVVPLFEAHGWGHGGSGEAKVSYLDPFVDVRTVDAIRRVCTVVKPDLVLSYTHKMTLLTALGARAAGVPRVHGMVTGLGVANLSGTLRQRAVRRAYFAALGVAATLSDSLIVLNRDNLATLEDSGVVPRHKLWCMDGEGVDTEAFEAPAPSPSPGEVTFLMVARLVWHKGVGTFVEAARAVKAAHPDARFVLAGGSDPNHPDAVPAATLDAWRAEGAVELPGFLDDIQAAYGQADVFVLPSGATEGLPMSLMEAMSARRPLITTAEPGNRETVEEGVNGFLVPTGDAAALADRMAWCCAHADRLPEMGEASRARVCSRFDHRIVNAALLDHLGLAT